MYLHLAFGVLINAAVVFWISLKDEQQPLGNQTTPGMGHQGGSCLSSGALSSSLDGFFVFTLNLLLTFECVGREELAADATQVA